MKRVVQILLAHLAFCFVLCLVYQFFVAPLPDLLPSVATRYKFFGALRLFCEILPAILITGFVIGSAVAFGRNPAGSERRFSEAMFRRYRHVLVASIISALALTAASEIGMPFFAAKQNQYERMPALVREYVRLGRELQRNGRNLLAYRYGELAAQIDSNSADAARLMNDTELAARNERDAQMMERGAQDGTQGERTQGTQTVSEEGYTVDELRSRAENAFAAERWFDAHYYAQTGVSISTPRNANYERLREIAADAWNRLSEAEMPAQNEDARLFAQKFQGYSAFMQGDNLKAYYIFHSLAAESTALAHDPDVSRYLALALDRLRNETFFTDEILDAREFETAANVHFALRKADGSRDIVSIKGVTPAEDAAGAIQYLRGLSIFSIDENGGFVSSMYVPYAKMLQVRAADFDEMTRHSLGVGEADFVPYILLRAIDRNNEDVSESPVYEGDADESGQMTLPISYGDFSALCETSRGAARMGLFSLFDFAGKARCFGYAEEVFVQVLLNRTLYPLFMIIVLICFATFAWNYRLGEKRVFKLAWIFTLPFFSLLAWLACRALLWLYKLINYVFVGAAGLRLSLPLAVGVYVVILIIVSIVFLARNAKDEA